MSDAQPFLVYRDRIGAASETGFLRRQYISFTRLRPVWIGRTLLPGAAEVGSDCLRLGGSAIGRLRFRHFGWVPPLPPAAPILHAQFARGGALALPIARGGGMRLAVTLHGGDVSKAKNWRGTLLAHRWPALLREAARFICVSDAVAEIARARGVPPGKLTVLPIGVEIPAAPPERRPEAHLFVGRFVEKKGIAVLADAIRILRAQGDRTPVVCVGDGPLRGMLEAVAREHGNVVLTGWLRPEEVRARMLRAVSLLVPSIIAANGDAEGLPSVIPEAMAQACPVIGSDQGGIAEAISNGRTGLLVPPGDAAALAEAITRVKPALGLAGYDYAMHELNARIQSTALEDLLLGL